MTRVDSKEFELIYLKFKKNGKKSVDAPRFSEYTNKSGNTCILSVRHVFLIAPAYKRTGIKQGVLVAISNIDQSKISRYITHADRLLLEMLSTIERISRAISETDSCEKIHDVISTEFVLV